MRCKISELKELTFASNKKVIGFNVLVIPDDERLYLAIPGFLLIAGSIYLPKVKRKNNWFPTLYVGKELGELIYDSLEETLSMSLLAVSHILNNNKELAISELTDTNAVTRLFPGMI